MNSQVEKNTFYVRGLEDIPISRHHRTYVNRPILSPVFFLSSLYTSDINIFYSQWSMTYRKSNQSWLCSLDTVWGVWYAYSAPKGTPERTDRHVSFHFRMESLTFMLIFSMPTFPFNSLGSDSGFPLRFQKDIRKPCTCRTQWAEMTCSSCFNQMNC